MLTPEDEPLDVLWKDPTTNPSENITRLSQIASVYASKTIDKAIEVQSLLKEKEDRILFLEQQLQQVSINQEAETQLAKLQQCFQQMQLVHQSSLDNKEEYIQGMIELHEDNPKIGSLLEALALNSQLLQQKQLLCQKISQSNSHCEMSNNITKQVVEL